MKNNFRYEQEKDSEYKTRKQELIEFILDKDYGYIIPFEDIAKILRINIELEEEIIRLKNIVGSIKKYLTGKGRVLMTVRNIGYYILKPKEVSSYCYRTYVKGSMRMLDKSSFILECTDKTELSDERAQEINQMIELNTKLANNMWETVKESGYYNRMDYYNSLKD